MAKFLLQDKIKARLVQGNESLFIRKEGLMSLKRRLPRLFFVATFCLLFVKTDIRVYGLQAQNPAPSSTLPETASYPGLQPDQFMTKWLVLGPLPIFKEKPKPEDQETQKKAFGVELVTPKTAGIKAGQSKQIGEKKYAWRFMQATNEIVDLTEAFGDSEFVSAYAWAEINAPEAKTVLMALGSDDGVKVWLNGQQVHENWIGRAVVKDNDFFPLSFKKGRNQLLLKVQNMQQAWGFCCRIIGPSLFTEKLVSSAAQGNLDALNLLLSHGAEVNGKTKSGLTAWQAAKINGRDQAAKVLLEKGANAKISMPAPEALVDALFADTGAGESPGAAVLIAQDGKIMYQKGFGFANLENRVPITVETKFRIGSITKQFTGAAILKLQEAGLLNVQDPLSKFMPDYPRGNEVTIHQLLTHISGIHSYTNKPDFLQTVTVEAKPESLIASFRNDKYDFDPGTQWRYNNSGYFLLGYIIAKTANEPYETYLKKNFFTPLDMKDTGEHRWSDILTHEATGYSYLDGKFQKAQNWDMSRAGGAGALYSTVTDLYRWNEAVFNGKVLSEKSLTAAFTPVTLKDGGKPQTFGGGYGYGWGMSDFRGVKEISHGGGLHGFVTNLARYPEHNMTITVLTNCAPQRDLNPSALTREIAQIYLWEKMASQESYATDTAVDPKFYDDYVGRYEYPGGAIMTVTRDGNQLFAQLTGQPRFEIFPNSATAFFWKVVDAQITFVKNEKGEVIHGLHRQGGQTLTVPRLKAEAPAKIDPGVYVAYAGEYQLAPNAIMTVTKEGEQLFVQLTGQPKFEIYPRSETEFFLQVVKADIKFVKDDTDKVASLVLKQGGVEQTAKKIK
jgi:CubicO group peptidase (beta-lactamase class C family)